MKIIIRICLFFLFFSGLLTARLQSQSLQIISCDTLVSGTNEPDNEITAKVTIKNITLSPVSVRTKVNYLQKTEGHTYQFCDLGLCYPGGTNDEVTSTQPFQLESNQTTGNFLHLYLYPNKVTGISKFKMTFFLDNNPNDLVSFNVTFNVAVASAFDFTNFDSPDLSIYPNPAKNFVCFKYLQPSDNLNTKIEIFTTNGELIATYNNSNDVSLNLCSFPAGSYYSRMTVEGKLPLTKKFVIEK